MVVAVAVCLVKDWCKRCISELTYVSKANTIAPLNLSTLFMWCMQFYVIVKRSSRSSYPRPSAAAVVWCVEHRHLCVRMLIRTTIVIYVYAVIITDGECYSRRLDPTQMIITPLSYSTRATQHSADISLNKCA